MKFRAKKDIKEYKSVDKYLDAVYRANKAIIDKNFSFPDDYEYDNIRSPKTIFKEMVKSYRDNGYSTKGALDKIGNSTLFTSYQERAVKNVRQGLKTFGKAREFKELTKVNGRYQKFDESKLIYDPTQNIYIYDNKVVISFATSPQDLLLGVI